MHRESRAIKKMCGIETELGVNKTGESSVSASAGSFIENIMPEWIGEKFTAPVWDPTERIEKLDQNDTGHRYLRDKDWIEQYNHLLPNGARLYLDGSHPEISGPIANDPRMLVIWNQSCYRWIDLIRKKHKEINKEEYRLIRNNIGMAESYSSKAQSPASIQRQSFACHLNMTVGRFVNRDELSKKIIPWFISQLPISGAGKVGADEGRPHTDFQISQRADFMFQLVSHETMYKRPWDNTRDRPYADADRFRCLHMIPFDSNMLELPEYLKAGLTAILLMMIEDNELDDRFEIQNPLNTAILISRDTDLRFRVWLTNQQKSRLVIDCLRDYHDLFASYLEQYHPDNSILKDVVNRFDEVLNLCSCRDWAGLFGKLDWVTKKLFIEQAIARKQKTWGDWLAYRLDTEYHNNDHETGLFYKTIMPLPEIVRIATDREIDTAMMIPPPTRARWIWETIQCYQKSMHSSDYYYCITFFDSSRNTGTSLFFPDPNTPWDKHTARELFALPLNEFLIRIKEKGLAKTLPAYRITDPAKNPTPTANTRDNQPSYAPGDRPVENMQTFLNKLWGKFNKKL